MEMTFAMDESQQMAEKRTVMQISNHHMVSQRHSKRWP